MIEINKEKRLIRKGQKLITSGNLEKAFIYFEKATMINNSTNNQFYLGLSLMSLSKFEDAKKYFTQIYHQNSENELNLLSLAECNMMQRKWLSAETNYYELCKLFPQNKMYKEYQERAADVILREKYVIARELFAKAERALFEKNKKEALTYLFEAEEYHPNNPNILNNIGSLLILEKDFEKAYKYIEKAISIAPNNKKFQTSFIQIKRKLRK